VCSIAHSVEGVGVGNPSHNKVSLRVPIRARGNTQKYTETPKQNPLQEVYIFTDINGDGVVNVLDLVLVANAFE
jgi:hypothetical protein